MRAFAISLLTGKLTHIFLRAHFAINTAYLLRNYGLFRNWTVLQMFEFHEISSKLQVVAFKG